MKETVTYIKDFYTLEQLEKEINVKIPTLRNCIKDGELKASIIGNRYIVQRTDVIEWLNNHKQ